MSKILAFAGAKQSGKNTCCNFLHGYELFRNDVVDSFDVDTDGNLMVNTVIYDAKGEKQEGMGLLDVTRDDLEFAPWAAHNMWPYVKHYSFASPLKEIAVGLFGITEEQCYGTDQEKNTPINIKWEDMPTKVKQKGFMTAREFLQHFGTDICRSIKPDIWTGRCMRQILQEGSGLAIISDCRFPNEVEAVRAAGGKVIKLTRNIAKDGHSSENALSGYKDFDSVIDNASMNIQECNQSLLEIVNEWGWIPAVHEPEEPETPKEHDSGATMKIKTDAS